MDTKTVVGKENFFKVKYYFEVQGPQDSFQKILYKGWFVSVGFL